MIFAKGKFLLAVLFFMFAPYSFAEARSTQEMVKECRVALDVLQGRAERNYDNTFFAAQCVGYLQGITDVSLVLADHIKGLKSCAPERISTVELIQKFIAFVEANPKYTSAPTAFQTMLSQEFPCKK